MRRHAHQLNATDAILVVVDMQEPFLRVIHDRDRLVSNVSRLIRGAAILGVPALYTVQNRKAIGDVAQEIRDLLPAGSQSIDKMHFSCCDEPQFEAALSQAGRKQVILCGVESHICVCQTALGLIANGYQVHLCADAVSSRTEENWRTGIDRARQGSALITVTESVLYELLGHAGTPEFREILKLVK